MYEAFPRSSSSFGRSGLLDSRSSFIQDLVNPTNLHAVAVSSAKIQPEVLLHKAYVFDANDGTHPMSFIPIRIICLRIEFIHLYFTCCITAGLSVAAAALVEGAVGAPVPGRAGR